MDGRHRFSVGNPWNHVRLLRMSSIVVAPSPILAWDMLIENAYPRSLGIVGRFRTVVGVVVVRTVVGMAPVRPSVVGLLVIVVLLELLRA